MEIAYGELLRSLEADPCPRRTVTPPNRLETSNWELIAALMDWRSPRSLEQLRGLLRERTGRQHIFFAPSCRAAIAQVLSLLPHKEVVMPAFTCPVVKSAVQLAGNPIVYVDVAKQSVNATAVEYAKQAQPGRVLLPTHLFGIPTDIEDICSLARARDCVTIEDAAAAFGGTRNGRALGTSADIGVYSFEKSKRVPAFRGAVVIINNDRLIDVEKLRSSRIVPTERRLPLRELAFSLAYNLATVPWLYGRVTLPRLLRRYRRTLPLPEFDPLEAMGNTPFYKCEFHPYQAALVLRVLRRMNEIRAHISRLVSIYRDILQGACIEALVPHECDEGALLRFPIAVRGKARGEVLRRTLREGLYLETNYEHILAPESEWAAFPNSQWAARNLLLLPLYRALSPKVAETMARAIVRIAGEAPEAESKPERDQTESNVGEALERTW